MASAAQSAAISEGVAASNPSLLALQTSHVAASDEGAEDDAAKDHLDGVTDAPMPLCRYFDLWYLLRFSKYTRVLY